MTELSFVNCNVLRKLIEVCGRTPMGRDVILERYLSFWGEGEGRGTDDSMQAWQSGSRNSQGSIRD